MRHGRRDSTHKEIVQALRAVGVSVFDTADIGDGFPDLVCGFRGWTYLLEVKGPKGALRASQVAFAASWRGAPTIVVRSPAEALRALGLVDVAAQLETQCLRTAVRGFRLKAKVRL